MNLNKLAIELCKREGLKQQVNIAQVKEILRCLGEVLIEMDEESFPAAVNALLGWKAKSEKKEMKKTRTAIGTTFEPSPRYLIDGKPKKKAKKATKR